MNDYYDLAIQKLFPRKKNKVRNSLFINDVNDMKALGSFIHCSYKRSHLNNVNFIEINLRYSAWTDSFFKNTRFDRSNLNGCNFQLCIFEDSYFKDIQTISNASFNHSYFKNTTFENIIFKNCVFSDAIFIDCKFVNCKFASSS